MNTPAASAAPRAARARSVALSVAEAIGVCRRVPVELWSTSVVVTIVCVRAGLPARRSIVDEAVVVVDGVRVAVLTRADGPLPLVARDLAGAVDATVDALVLVTARARHTRLPRSIAGVPLAVVYVGRERAGWPT